MTDERTKPTRVIPFEALVRQTLMDYDMRTARAFGARLHRAVDQALERRANTRPTLTRRVR